MSKVDLLNGTLAGLITQKLDALDGKKDNQIKASIWNEFVQDKGGTSIPIDSFQKVDNETIGKVMRFAINNAKSQGKTIDGLANEWLKKLSKENNKSELEANNVVKSEEQQDMKVDTIKVEINAEKNMLPTSQLSAKGVSSSLTMNEQERQEINNVLDNVREDLQQQIIARQDNLKDVSNGVNQVAQINSEKVEEVIKANEKKNKEIITNLIKEEAISRGLNNDKLNKIDFEKVTDIIYRCSNNYKIDPKIIISIIGEETGGKFDCPDSNNGAGPMQLIRNTLIDVVDSKYWSNICRSIDPVLYDEIVNHTSVDGKKCTNSVTMRKECGKDPEYGIKVGILVFKLKYIKAVSEKIYGSIASTSIIKCIKLLNSTTEPILSAEDNKKCLKRAFWFYNGNEKQGKDGKPIRDGYADRVAKSLIRQDCDYSNMLQGSIV